MPTCGRGCNPNTDIRVRCELDVPKKNSKRQFYNCPMKIDTYVFHALNDYDTYKMITNYNFYFVHHTLFSNQEMKEIIQEIVLDISEDVPENYSESLKEILAKIPQIIEEYNVEIDLFEFDFIKQYELSDDDNFFLIYELVENLPNTNIDPLVWNPENCVICLEENKPCTVNPFECSCRFHLCKECHNKVQSCVYCYNKSLQNSTENQISLLSVEQQAAVDYMIENTNYRYGEEYQCLQDDNIITVIFSEEVGRDNFELLVMNETSENILMKKVFSEVLFALSYELLVPYFRFPVSEAIFNKVIECGEEANDIIKDWIQDFDELVEDLINDEGRELYLQQVDEDAKCHLCTINEMSFNVYRATQYAIQLLD